MYRLAGRVPWRGSFSPVDLLKQCGEPFAANHRRIYSRLLDSMPSDESDKFIKDWDAKVEALDRDFLRLMTDRLHEQAEWWWTYIPDRNERPDYWTKPEQRVAVAPKQARDYDGAAHHP